MNANELADKSFMGLWDAYTSKKMECEDLEEKLRHQQAELKDADKYALELERLYEDAKAEIEALKDFAIWMTGCGYDFCQHEYFNRCRDELLIGKAQEK